MKVPSFISSFRQTFKSCFIGPFKQLLLFLILLFIFRPYLILGIDYIALWNLFFTGVVLSTIFNCHHTKKIKLFSVILGIPTFIFSWQSLLMQSEWAFLAGLFSSLLFLVFAIFFLLQKVLMGKVTSDILRGTICVYFMIGFAFSIAYTILEFFHPGSLHGLTAKSLLFPHGHYHSEMVYFSFITLLAIGYGDITPVGDIPQMVVVAEGLIGQFYLAILVARIVGVYTLKAKKAS